VTAEIARVRAGFGPAMRASTDAALRDLAAAGLLRTDVTLPEPALPRALEEMLASALALEGPTAHAELLRAHYLVTMPRLRVEQLASEAQPNTRFFHTPLDWARLPRLSGIVDAVFALEPALLGAASPAAFRDRYPTLAALYLDTYYGAAMPLLYGYPADLAWFARALAEEPLETVLDRHLAGPILHELMHGRRERPPLFPLSLDECVAGYLGIRLLPSFAYPEPGEANAIFAAPWFSQVGQALVRTVGLDAVVRAQAGQATWEEALPHGLAATLHRLGWDEYVALRQPHFLSDPYRPDRWMKLFFLAAAGVPLDEHTLASLEALPWTEVPPGEEQPMDREILVDALRAMCLRNRQDAYHFVVSSELPRAPIRIDLGACRVETAPGADGCDPVPLRYLFPPAVAARLRARGTRGYVVALPSLDAIADVADAIIDEKPNGYVTETQ
jgi:hypothetical protein